MTDGVRTLDPIVAHADDVPDMSEMPYGVDCSPFLPTGVNLDNAAGVTASVSPSSGLTITTPQTNTATVTDNSGATIAANQGVIFSKATGSTPGAYDVTFQVQTAGGTVLKVVCPFIVKS